VVREGTGPPVVALSGDLDIATAPSLRAELSEVNARGGDVVVDLRGLRFIDSTGLGVLVAARRDASDRGHKVTLRGPSSNVVHLLAISGLDGLFAVEQ
jgi:anti-sigma B factor antagonist